MNQPVLRALAAAAFAAAAAPALALDLMGAYEKAQSHDPTLAAARSEVLAGREKAIQGRALLLPQVQLTAGATYLKDHSSSSSLPPQLQDVVKPNGSGTLHEVALEAKQPLWAPKSRADKQQLEQQTALAEVKHRDAQQQLIQRVAQAYFNVLLAEENLRVARAEKAAVTLQRDRAQARFDVGRGRITEVQESQARLDSVVTRELQADSTLELRRAQFEELTGDQALGLAALRPGFVPQPPQPDSAAAWQQQAVAQNTRVLFRQGELAIAGFEIEKYKLAARPTLDLVASTSYKGQSGGLSELTAPDGKRSTMIGLQFSVPLYAGGAITSKERESVARRSQAEQEVAAAMRDARLQAQDAYLAVRTGVSRIGSLEQSVRSDTTALEATMLGRDLGTRTELDVLDAQQRLYASQRDLAQARNDYLIGRIQLAAAAGALNEGDLAALNQFLAH
ncbi:MAG: TolC family outer membrane protein [Piscinibacter sp.]|uniref:TolC family outer membrane protein n=1 Tax=Piscinibacter TaxID=1114981 RepID=UPI000FDE79F8|nr:MULTISPECIES: TolC family outer membrane protein [Piscinibacter]MCW5668002.1 TolC family outer membrane protein [Piscinibacter sp.]